MYCEFYHFARMPFANTADPQFYFKTPEHEEALAALVYGATQRRGVTVVTGRPGSGKTLIGHMLTDSLRAQADVATILHAPETGHDLIASLCRELGVRFRASYPTGELVQRLRSQLLARFHDNRCIVAIIDEAQNMTPEVLEHLRMLGNLEKDSAKLLQIVLLGQPELVEMLKQQQFAQLRQRVFCSCELKPLERDQTRNYIRHRIKVGGGEDLELFSDEAIDLIHDRSGGLPRMINQIADNALLAAFGASRERIDRQMVASCINEMMALQVQRSPEAAPEGPRPASAAQPAPPSLVPFALADAAGLQTDRATRTLSELIPSAAEITGRLGEVSRNAGQQAAELAGLITRAETAAAELGETHQASAVAASKGLTRVEELTRLVTEAHATQDSLRAARSELAGLADRLTTLVDQARPCSQRLESASFEAERCLQEHIGKAEQLLEQIGGQHDSLASAGNKAESIQAEVVASIQEGQVLRDGLAEVTAAAATQASATKDMSERARKHAESLDARLNEAKIIVGHLDETHDRLIASFGPSPLQALEDKQVLVQELLERAVGQCGELSAETRVVESLRKQVVELTQQADQQQETLASISTRAEAIQNEITASVQEAQELRNALTGASAEAANRTTAGREVAGQLQEQSVRLDAQLSDAEAASSRLDELHDRLATSFSPEVVQALESRQSQIRALLDQVAEHSGGLSAAVQTAASLREQVLESVQQAADRHSSLSSTSTQAEAIHGKIVGSIEEAEDLQRNLAGATAAAAQQQDALTSVSGRAESIQDEITSSVREAEDLGNALTGASAEAANRTTAVREVAGQLHEQSVHLDTQLSDAEAASARLDELHDRLAASFGPEAVQALEGRQSQVRALLDQVAEHSGGLSAAVQTAASLREQVLESVQQAADRHSSLSSTSTQAEVIHGKIVASIEEAEDLQSNLAGATTAAAEQSAAGRKVSKRLQEQVHSLNTRISEAGAASAHLEEVQGKLMTSFGPQAMQALEDGQGRIRELLDQTGERCAELNAAAGAAESLRKRVTESVQGLEDKESAARSLLDQAGDRCREMSEAGKAAGSLREQVIESKQQLADLRNDLAKAAASTDEWVAAAAALGAQARKQLSALGEEVRQAGRTSFALAQASQKAEFAEANCATRTRELGAKLDRAGQCRDQLEQVMKRVDELHENLGGELAATLRAREEVNGAVERLSRERALADASARRLADLRRELEQEGRAAVAEAVRAASNDGQNALCLAGAAARSVRALDPLRHSLDQLGQDDTTTAVPDPSAIKASSTRASEASAEKDS